MPLIEINVTEADIKDGKRKCAELCPVARALEAATGRQWEVTERSAVCWGNWAKVKLPLKVWNFVKEFDDGYPVRPFNFYVEVPDSLMEGAP